MAAEDHIYTIVVGNPFDGMSCHGLYPDFAAAVEAAVTHYTDENWWVEEILGVGD